MEKNAKTENKRIPNLEIEDCEVLPGSFRNFAGRADRFNKEGDRNFNIIVPGDMVRPLLDAGWNVKLLKPREGEEDAIPRYRLTVAVSFREFKSLPPTRVYLHSGGRRTQLTEETVETLDYADYQTADLTIRPRRWLDERSGDMRIKAYLQEMHVCLEESRWARKYASYGQSDPEDEDGDIPF